MRLLSRNRRPVADDPIMYEGIPYRILSEPNREGFIEVVDPWGNQMLFRHINGLYLPWSPDYLSKRSIEGLRRMHPEMADELDTDYGNPYRNGDATVWDRRNGMNLEFEYANRKRYYHRVDDGSYGLVSEQRSIRGLDDYNVAKRMYERMGVVPEDMDDHPGVHGGYRYTYYDRSSRDWVVDEWAVMSDMDEYMTSAAPPFKKPKAQKGDRTTTSKNRHGRGRR